MSACADASVECACVRARMRTCVRAGIYYYCYCYYYYYYYYLYFYYFFNNYKNNSISNNNCYDKPACVQASACRFQAPDPTEQTSNTRQMTHSLPIHLPTT
jgi:hypothetical protein